MPTIRGVLPSTRVDYVIPIVGESGPTWASHLVTLLERNYDELVALASGAVFRTAVANEALTAGRPVAIVGDVSSEASGQPIVAPADPTKFNLVYPMCIGLVKASVAVGLQCTVVRGGSIAITAAFSPPPVLGQPVYLGKNTSLDNCLMYQIDGDWKNTPETTYIRQLLGYVAHINSGVYTIDLMLQPPTDVVEV